jgi:hypothetical protein
LDLLAKVSDIKIVVNSSKPDIVIYRRSNIENIIFILHKLFLKNDNIWWTPD